MWFSKELVGVAAAQVFCSVEGGLIITPSRIFFMRKQQAWIFVLGQLYSSGQCPGEAQVPPRCTTGLTWQRQHLSSKLMTELLILQYAIGSCARRPSDIGTGNMAYLHSINKILWTGTEQRLAATVEVSVRRCKDPLGPGRIDPGVRPGSVGSFRRTCVCKYRLQCSSLYFVQINLYTVELGYTDWPEEGFHRMPARTC